MDSETKPRSKVKAKKNGRKNEKKKKVVNKRRDETLDEVCRQMSNLVDEDNNDGGSGSSTDEDFVNAINYNTITSLAALKDIIQGDNNDTPETDSFFQHYFMNHCNNLSSRNSSSSNSPFLFAERRRLSQCREEDEDDEKKDGDRHLSAESSESDSEVTSQGSFNTLSKDGDDDSKLLTDEKSVDDNDNVDSEDQSPSKRTVIGARHKFLVTTAETPPPTMVERVLRTYHNAHTVHFGTRGAEEQRPSVRNIFPGQNLHHDKHYFDSSLIEIRSTIDPELTSEKEIWVKRADDKQVIF